MQHFDYTFSEIVFLSVLMLAWLAAMLMALLAFFVLMFAFAGLLCHLCRV